MKITLHIVEFIGYGIASLFFIFMAYVIGWQNKKEEDQEASVKAGKAEYYLDENNEKQWRWK